MIKILEDQEHKEILITTAVARLTEADWARVIPETQKRIEESGQVRWYFEMTDFSQDSPWITLEEAGLHQLSRDAFARIAIVGNKEWQGWMRDLMQPFNSAQIRFFEIIYQDKAHQWIKG